MAKNISPKRRDRAAAAAKKGRTPKGLMPLTGGDHSGIEEMARSFARRDDSPLEPKTPAQADYIEAIQSSFLTFGLGPAGTGKTYIAATMAADMLLAREIDQIILTRPAVEAGESLGFLPGELEEKYAPFMAPLLDVLNRRIGKGPVEAMIKGGRIEMLPLAFMRGRSLRDAFIILDEAQNTTPTQMKMFLTRMGENSRILINGDLSQIDLPRGQPSGLSDALRRVQHLPFVSVVNFTKADVVRSGPVQMIVTAYENPVSESDREGLERVLGLA